MRHAIAIVALLLIAAAVALFAGAPAASAPDDHAWHFCTCAGEMVHHGQHTPYRYDNTPDMAVRET